MVSSQRDSVQFWVVYIYVLFGQGEAWRGNPPVLPQIQTMLWERIDESL
ncbi:MAG: hypothetical protein F6J87_05385 [Spirulina sp. SIO3F2]|nr:hypothetical protein [Spirulina sp. SIO3F2]